jgi:glycerophosphoryl diester phosphodiesterase
LNDKTNKIFIIGHRGAYKYPPENSLKSFHKAIELGADFTEFDLHLSKDNEIVIMHDENTLRTTGFKGLIKNLTLEELKELDCGEGEKIPTLNELIEIAKGKIGFLCEIKAKGLEKRLVEILTANNLIESTIIDSFYIEELLRIKKLEPTFKLGLVVPIDETHVPKWEKRKEMIDNVINNKLSYILTRFNNIDQKFINYSHSNDIKVIAYPINTKILMKRFINMGVDGMIVNDILKAKKVLRNHQFSF